MDIIKILLERMNIHSNIHSNNVKSIILFVSNWLYETSDNDTQMYKNITNDEFKELYSAIEIHMYKTLFSFTNYQKNKQLVIIYFLQYIYKISYDCAKIVYILYCNKEFDNKYLEFIIHAYNMKD